VSDDLVNRLLGGGDPDLDCEACFERIDVYAEAVLRGAISDRQLLDVVTHLAGCPACREIAEGLIAALRAGAPPDDTK